jgi:hypothetical protein
MFKQRVRAVNYEHGHNKYLIQVMKKALNVEIMDMVYSCRQPKSAFFTALQQLKLSPN